MKWKPELEIVFGTIFHYFKSLFVVYFLSECTQPFSMSELAVSSVFSVYDR